MPDKEPPSEAPPVSGRGRLPWWAAVLPVVAFVVLLTLLLGGSGAGAASHPGNAVGELLAAVLEQIAYALLRG